MLDEPAPGLKTPHAALKGGVFALGNFDGVHRGHQSVLAATVQAALSRGTPARVLTFEPHPRSVFKPNQPPFRLTPAPAKERLLREFGASDVILHPFNLELSRLSAREFVEDILVGTYGIQHAVAGFDFVFGHDRGGNMKSLQAWLEPHKIGVTEVPPFKDFHGQIISSSRTRTALQKGDLRTVHNILGRAWSIAGLVEHGAKRGRTIGVPTANINLGEYQRPKYGVYAVKAGPVGQPASQHGVANIGIRPTVDGQTEVLEVHLFDFDDTIYDQAWEVTLLDFIRPEKAFPDIETLRRQIAQDMASAKALLKAL
ncbi:MAG: bifunctional riboflavin kinase/FAD synthetase [Pseudomonadota bacterium]|nr:bifunctional riboflavin kinase/FAD synthetase [Pseudomonadota bacterium]